MKSTARLFFVTAGGSSAETCGHLVEDPSGQVGALVVFAIAIPIAYEVFPSGTMGAVFLVTS